MELCTCTVRHAGNLGMTIEKGEHNPVTPAEIVILKHIHGDDAVVGIAFNRNTVRSNLQELDRLRAFFGEKVVADVFPGVRPQLPTTLAEAGLIPSDEPEEPGIEDDVDGLAPPPADVVARVRQTRAPRAPADLTG